jgi:tetratricopeptide (TPR) repeat protein
MRLYKLHSPFLIFCLAMLLMQSCAKKSQNDVRSPEYSILLDSAEIQSTNRDYSRAFYYFNNAKSSCDPEFDNEKIIYTLIRMAGIQQILGDFSGSEATATEALDYFNETIDPDYKISIYNILGLAYEEQDDYEDALLYYQKTLGNTTDSLQQAILKNNIAVVHMDKNDYLKAIKMLLPLQKTDTVKKHPETYARILDNIGYCYFKTNDPKGINFLEESLALRIKIQDDFGMIPSYFHLSEYHENQNPALALQYAKSAYDAATRIKSADARLETLGRLIKDSPVNQAKQYALLHIRLNDSLNKARQKAKNQFAKIRYDSTKDREENLKLKSQKQKLGFGFAIFAIAAIFTVLLIRSRNKTQQLKSVYDTETSISKRLHDELGNDFFLAMTYAETQDLQNPNKKETLLDSLEKIYNRIRDISKENSPIDTGVQYESNLMEMLSGFNTPEINIIIKNNVADWKSIQPKKKDNHSQNAARTFGQYEKTQPLHFGHCRI